MKTLMEMLVREQERLEEILAKARDELQQAPEGSLRLSSRRKAMQFYRRLPEAEKRILMSQEPRRSSFGSLPRKHMMKRS